MSAFLSVSNNVLQYNKVCDKEVFVNSSNLQLILCKNLCNPMLELGLTQMTDLRAVV